LAWRFLPPKPYFSSFFWRFWLPPLRPPMLPRPEPDRESYLASSLSMPTSNRSASLVPRPAPPVS
jgi:hypothetical protein